MSIFEYDEEAVKEMWREDFREEGRKEGHEEGRKEGLEFGIKAVINVCRGFGMSEEETLQKLEVSFVLSAEEARSYVVQYWNQLDAL